MIKRLLPVVIFLGCLFACTEDLSDKNKQAGVSKNDISDSVNYKNRTKYSGLSLINGRAFGTGFTDTSGFTKLFRSLTFKLANDTTLPVTLQLQFSDQTYTFLHSDNKKFIVFILPDSIKSVGKTLSAFLKSNFHAPSAFQTTLAPNSSADVRLGMIFYSAHGLPDGFTSEEICFKGQNFDQQDSSISLTADPNKIELLLRLSLHSKSNYHASIPCGQILFSAQRAEQ